MISDSNEESKLKNKQSDQINNNRIKSQFDIIKSRDSHALICYIVAGYPDRKTFFEIVQTLADCGVDILEIGIPFSDPIADGPIIQNALYHSLLDKVTPFESIEMISSIREKFPQLPIVVMTYSNILYRQGFDSFLKLSKEKGIDGFLLADMPIEEATDYIERALELDLATIFLISPNTSEARINEIASRTSGFIYMVSVYGTTGTRREVAQYSIDAIKNAKKISANRLPLAVGFGISNPEHARIMLESGADAIIVGSALIELIDQNLSSHDTLILKLREFITNLKIVCTKN